jgi:AhpD family alkylhydroperoxidase
MEPRVNLAATPVVARALKHFATASQVLVAGSTVPRKTLDLVMLRASQVNGCGYCTDIHTKDAAHAGDSAVRLNLVATWRESTVFTDAERAALELTEQGTRIADAAGGVPEETWARAAEHYDDDQLGVLVSIIALINASNRMGVITRMQGGSYQVGQLG